MKDEKNNSDNMENKAQKFFQKRAESFKVGKDLWSKLEPRLDEKQNVYEPAKQERKILAMAGRTAADCDFIHFRGTGDTGYGRFAMVNQ